MFQQPCPSREILADFATGRLDLAGIEDVSRHLEDCQPCAETLSTLQLNDTLLGVIHQQPMSNQADDPAIRELLSRVQCLAETPDTEHDDVPLSERLTCLRPGQSADELGRLGQYRILQVIGVGGMGTVFLAEHLEHRRTVALKVMRPGLSESAAGRKRFLREIRALAAQDHPAIVPVLDVGEDNGVPFFAMPLLRGETLEARLKRDDQIPVMDSIHIAREIANGLVSIHERGLVHRDIKPSNVFLCREAEVVASASAAQLEPANRVMLMDFGLVRTQGQASWQTQAGTVLGTPQYIAPEQIDGAEVDGRADLFSLGCVLFRMCTGTLPFMGRNPMSVLVAVTHDVPPTVMELNPETPPALSDLIGRLLSKDRELRPQTAIEVCEQLEAIARNPNIRPFPPILQPQAAKVKRSPRRVAFALALLMVLVGIPVLLMIASQISYDRQKSLLKGTIQSDLEAADWSPVRLEHVENQLKNLETLDLQQAAVLRKRLWDKFRDATVRWLDQPRLDADTIARVEQHIAAMKSRSPEAASELDKRLHDRLHKWETVFELTANSADADQWFDASVVRPQNGTALLVGHAGAISRTMSRAESLGNVRVDAVFDPSWEGTAEIGLLCHSRLGGDGYEFVLSSESKSHRPSAETESNTSFTGKWQKGLPSYLSILRNGVCQREIQVHIASGPLTMRATRTGDRLEVQVNNASPLTFADAFPIPSQGGYYGILAGGELRISRLHTQRQALPVKPSPLESGDELLSREKYGEALAAYERQIVADSHAEIGLELKYKTSLCLLHLNRRNEAIEAFTQLMAEPGSRWPLLAACQLWLLQLQQDGFEQAQALLTQLSARYRPDELLVLLPDDLRRSILSRYTGNVVATNVLLYDPNRLRHAEEVVDVANFLQVPADSHAPNRWGLQQWLFRAYLLAGQHESALQTARRWFQQCEALPASARYYPLHLILSDYVWLMRSRGDAQAGLTELDRWLFSAPGVLVEESIPSAKLLLERGRLHAALNDWDATETDIRACLRLLDNPKIQSDYAVHSGTHLLHGFLCERRGDFTAAKDAWRLGTFKAWKPLVPRELWGDDVIGPYFDSRGLQDLIMASLGDELTEADAQEAWNRTMASISSNELLGRITRSIPAAPAMTRMWRSARGRESARRMAFHEVPYVEYIGLPPRLLATELLFQGAFGGVPNAAQDEFVWGLVKDGYESYARGELSQTQLVSLGLFWSVTGSAATWPLLSNTIPKSLRKPVAYVMGQRFAQRGNLADAAKMFRQALILDPVDSPVRDLAQTALDRLPDDVRSAP